MMMVNGEGNNNKEVLLGPLEPFCLPQTNPPCRTDAECTSKTRTGPKPEANVMELAFIRSEPVESGSPITFPAITLATIDFTVAAIIFTIAFTFADRGFAASSDLRLSLLLGICATFESYREIGTAAL
ncbi:unnamed protein product [Cuscuta campestris]|uniref:Uncharacterized protein n=1 Tax=Cuscuta campestris TaxID=132261 RepID=A0A484LHW2_9ASTE|nr:unnamed protein product [Cuscuta campestris]